MEFKIVSKSSVHELNTKINELIGEGWKPKGSHSVVTKHIHVQRAMTHHKYDNEYSQTMTKKIR